MTGEINRVPIGLLSFLDMKARGQSPRLLSGDLQAGIDLTRLYLENDRELQRQTISVSALGFNPAAILTVPSLELWLVHGLFLSGSTIAAATDCKVAGAVRRVDQTSGNNNTLTMTDVGYFDVGEAIMVGRTFECPMILRPGDICGVTAARLTLGTAPNCTVLLDFSRLAF